MIGKWSFVAIWLFLMLIVFGYTIGNKSEQGLLGAILGVLVFVGLCFVYAGIAFTWTIWQPSVPPCKNNKCKKFEDYENEEPVQDGLLYRCGCGTQYFYQKNKSGEVKFMELMSEDVKRPYMLRSRFGRWKPDIG